MANVPRSKPRAFPTSRRDALARLRHRLADREARRSQTSRPAEDYAGERAERAAWWRPTCDVWIKQGRKCREPAAVVIETGDAYCRKHYGPKQVDAMREHPKRPDAGEGE